MRVLLLAGLLTVVGAPFAAASETEIECQASDARRAPAEQRLDQPPASPAATIGRPTATQREAAEAPRPVAAGRRRSGKPIPDSQLIQPRGTL